MRKSISAIAMTLVITWCVPAFSGSQELLSKPAAQPSASPGTVVPQGSSLTLQRLLRAQLERSMRLSRLLSLLEQAPLPDPVAGTKTIIDEPDPCGLSGAPARGEEPDAETRERMRQERAVSDGKPGTNTTAGVR
jgi:hypothetical protein